MRERQNCITRAQYILRFILIAAFLFELNIPLRHNGSITIGTIPLYQGATPGDTKYAGTGESDRKLKTLSNL